METSVYKAFLILKMDILQILCYRASHMIFYIFFFRQNYNIDQVPVLCPNMMVNWATLIFVKVFTRVCTSCCLTLFGRIREQLLIASLTDYGDT